MKLMKRMLGLVVGLVLVLFGIVTIAASLPAPNPPMGMHLTGVAYKDANSQIPKVYRLEGDGLQCLLTATGGIWCR